ncbi:MAG TPA: carbohydrate ABC transporter permease [Chloroflexota bacterium]
MRLATHPSHRKGGSWSDRAKMALLLVVTAVNFFPIYWILVSAVKPVSEILSRSVLGILPYPFTLEHFGTVFTFMPYATYFRNSLVVATATTVVTLAVSALGGYALARLRFPGRNLIGRLVLFTYTVPSVLLLIPLFQIMVAYQINNTQLSLVLAHASFAIPFTLWLLRGFFHSLPAELEDAAMIDGASHLTTLLRVVLPLAAPGLVTAAMFSFILSWNEYLFALVFITDDTLRTIPLGVAANIMTGNIQPGHWPVLMAAAVISALPVAILFLFLQKSLVQGLTAGGVKGG